MERAFYASGVVRDPRNGYVKTVSAFGSSRNAALHALAASIPAPLQVISHTVKTGRTVFGSAQ